MVCIRYILLVVTLLLSFELFSVNITWTNGNGTNLWNDPLNWSTSSVPGVNDIAIFNGTDISNCNINANANVQGIQINAGYTGVVTQNAGITITIGSSNFSQAAGSFVGGNSSIDINGLFSLTGGSFLSTSGTLFIGGTFAANATLFTHSGGTFLHNSGEVEFDPFRNSCTQTLFMIDVINSTTFYNVELNGSQTCGVSALLYTNTNDSVNCVNDLRHTNGYLNGYWEVKNDLFIGSSSDGGLGEIIFNGTGAQQYDVNVAAPRTCIIVVDKTAGTVGPAAGTTDFSMQGFVLRAGSFTAPSGTMKIGGTFNANSTLFNHIAGTFAHNNGEVELDPYRNSCTQTTFLVDVLNNTTFYNVEINGSQSCGVSALLTTGTNDSINATNNFIHTDGYLNGYWEVKNDLFIGSSSDGGLGEIIFNGTGAQQYDVNAAAPRTCIIVVDKTAGTVGPAAGTTDFSIQGFVLRAGSFTAPSGTMKIGGTFNANSTLFNHIAGTFAHNNGEVELDPYRNSCTQTTFLVDVLNNTTFYNVEINGSQSCGVSALLTTGTNDSINATNNFIHTDGYLNGYWEVKNDLFIGSSSDGGLGEIIFNGTGAQQYDVNAAAPRTCIIVVDKTAGTVGPAAGTSNFSIQGFVLRAGSFTAPSGTMKIGGTFNANSTLFNHIAGTFAHNNGEVELDPYRNSCTQTTFLVDVLNNTTFYNVEINGSQSCGVSALLTTGTNDSINATNNFIHTNGYLNGYWEVKNDLFIGSSSDGGLGEIIFNGTGAQQYDVNAAAPRTCIIVVDKTAGTVGPAAGTSNFSIQGFVLRAGSFTAPSGTMKIGGTFNANSTLFNHIAGTFAHNNGEVELDPYRNSCTQTTFLVDVLNNTTFYNVEINGSQSCGVSALLTTGTNDSINATNNFIHTDGYLNGYWEVKNDLFIGSSSDGGLGEIIFNGTGAQQYNVNAAAPRTCIIIVDKTAGTVSPAAGTTDFSMQGFVLRAGSFTAPSGTMKIGGTFNANSTLFNHIAGTFAHNNGEVELDPYRNSCTQTTFLVDVLNNTTFYNVEINGSQSCGVSARIFCISTDSIYIDQDLLLTNGQFATGYLEADGDVTVGSSFDGGDGTLIFVGSANQNFDLTGAINLFDGDIKIIKNSNNVNLVSDLTMDAGAGRDLFLISGDLITSSSALLTLGDNVQTFNASSSSFVSGPMRKVGNDLFQFPVGKNDTAYAPIRISAPSLTTDHFTAEYFQNDPDPTYSDVLLSASIDHISSCEYWILDRTNGVSNVSVTLTWDVRSCGVTNLSQLLVARWDGSLWQNHGNGQTLGNTTAGEITSSGVVSNFSPFTLASTTANNPLPITLMEFTAMAMYNKFVELNWKTASERNNDHFEIERSVDAKEWQFVEKVKGAGNSNSILSYKTFDNNPFNNVSYYRLKQVDFNGEYSYSSIRSVKINSGSTFAIYPNPTNDLITIEGVPSLSSKNFKVINILGQEVTSYIKIISENSDSGKIDLSGLCEGTYIFLYNGESLKFIKQ